MPGSAATTREGKQPTENRRWFSARAIGALACGGGEMPNTMRDGSVTSRLLHAVPRRGWLQVSVGQPHGEPLLGPCLLGAAKHHKHQARLAGPGSIMACLACLIIAHKTGWALHAAAMLGTWVAGSVNSAAWYRPVPSLWSRSRGRNLSVSCFRLGWQLRAASQPGPLTC